MQKKEQLKSLLSAVLTARDNLNQIPKPLIFLKLSPDLDQQEKKDIANVVRDKKVRISLRLVIFSYTVYSNFVPSMYFGTSSEIVFIEMYKIIYD